MIKKEHVHQFFDMLAIALIVNVSFWILMLLAFRGSL